MRETTMQIDGLRFVFDDAGVEKQLKRRDGVLRVDANVLTGTATIAYDEARVTPDEIKASIDACGYQCCGEALRAQERGPGNPARTPVLGTVETHQAHPVARVSTSAAPTSGETKAEVKAIPVTNPRDVNVKPGARPPAGDAMSKGHAGHSSEAMSQDKAEMAREMGHGAGGGHG